MAGSWHLGMKLKVSVLFFCFDNRYVFSHNAGEDIWNPLLCFFPPLGWGYLRLKCRSQSSGIVKYIVEAVNAPSAPPSLSATRPGPINHPLSATLFFSSSLIIGTPCLC